MMKKHTDLAAFNALKADLRQKPLRALLRHWRNYDLGLRVISRRLFTNHGIQGEAVPAAILSLLPLLAGLARMRVSATLNRLVGVRLGQQCKVGWSTQDLRQPPQPQDRRQRHLRGRCRVHPAARGGPGPRSDWRFVRDRSGRAF